MVLAVVLYADDAAIPADSAEDLQLAAAILEEFCNEHRLFVATPKTFVTVFHPPDDEHVLYGGKCVFVDGQSVDVRIYGKTTDLGGSQRTLYNVYI